MSSVFIINVNFPYEGYTLAGVYSSKENAASAWRNYFKHDYQMPYVSKYIEIVEIIIDAPIQG